MFLTKEIKKRVDMTISNDPNHKSTGAIRVHGINPSICDSMIQVN